LIKFLVLPQQLATVRVFLLVLSSHYCLKVLAKRSVQNATSLLPGFSLLETHLCHNWTVHGVFFIIMCLCLFDTVVFSALLDIGKNPTVVKDNQILPKEIQAAVLTDSGLVLSNNSSAAGSR
jgi:hypothetical protein